MLRTFHARCRDRRSQVVVHELTSQIFPENFFDPDVLPSEDQAQIDLAFAQADTSAARYRDDAIVEGILQLIEAVRQPRRCTVELAGYRVFDALWGRSLLYKSTMEYPCYRVTDRALPLASVARSLGVRLRNGDEEQVILRRALEKADVGSSTRSAASDV